MNKETRAPLKMAGITKSGVFTVLDSDGNTMLSIPVDDNDTVEEITRKLLDATWDKDKPEAKEQEQGAVSMFDEAFQ